MPAINIKELPFAGNIRYFARWTLFSILIGAFVGAVGTVFGKTIILATRFWTSHSLSVWLMPVSGLLIVGFYHLLKAEKPRGTNLVISSISSGEEISFKMAPLIFVATSLTHLASASAGREGAALQLGGSLGDMFARILKLDRLDKNIAVMCGMSACFAALFGTPLAAAIFSMEVISVGVMYYAALIPCIFAAYTGAAVAERLGLAPERFPVAAVPQWNPENAVRVVILGIACALVSILFCEIMHKSEHLYQKYFKNPYLRVLAGAFIFIAITYLSGSRDYNGGGFPLIERCMEGEVRYEAFLLKMIFTAVALGAGFKGGEIVPTFTIGATFGCTFGILTGTDPVLATACGMVACFAGVTNCPIASAFMAIELFGAGGLPYYVVAIAVCFTLSGYYGLYSAQKFAYYKTRPQYVNAVAHEIRKIRNEKKES